ncbi:type III secretion protein [Pseudomonas rossensis]|uniref:type III secretion protein n=1 Tax=Pseudomonas rossensis TaxID=2305471 RepID=UPI003260C1F4
MDEEIEVDPQREAMEHVISVLTPLREHRQASAERALHRAKVDLAGMQEQLAQARENLTQERDSQSARRQVLATAHLQQAMTLSKVDHWQEKERQMLDRLSRLHQDIDQLGLQIDQQKILLEGSHQTAKARQRAVEKLACLSEALNEEG